MTDTCAPGPEKPPRPSLLLHEQFDLTQGSSAYDRYLFAFGIESNISKDSSGGKG